MSPASKMGSYVGSRFRLRGDGSVFQDLWSYCLGAKTSTQCKLKFDDGSHVESGTPKGATP